MEEKLLLKLSAQLDDIMMMLERNQKKDKRKYPVKIGRPSKEHIVVSHKRKYPSDSKMDCVRSTGLSIKTVSKYWNQVEKK